MRILFILSLLPLFLSGCYWENEEDLFGPSEFCDTTDVSFAEDVTPLLMNNCFGCHSNQNAPENASGFSLEDYQDVAENASLILGAIRHQDGILPMPRNREQLDSCQISVIEAWVNAGTPDN